MNAQQAREWQAQQQALAPAQADEHPLAERYRAVYQAVAQAELPALPPDLPAAVAAALRAAEVDEHIERWLLRAAGLLALIGIAVYAGPTLTEHLWFRSTLPITLDAGWLWATLLAGACAGLIDRWAASRAHAQTPQGMA
ncbi:MAG: hypothetical protein U1F26_16990 [Lysobacterales bacterium]